MADKKVVIEAEVKSNIGDVSKDASAAAGEFKVMGVSLNSVKAGFAKIIPTAKAMFGTIRAGIMSTGIGALLIAVTSLITYFTNTKRGADKLAQAFTAIGAVIDVLKDRISKVGEAISLVFSGEFRKAGEALKGTFAGIADEVEREVRAMVALKKRTQELRDADMEFMVQKAKTRQEIERARLIAEDETKSAKERLDNLKKALELEAETTKQELVLARERMEIQKQEMALSENTAEDEEKLAQLKVALIETETASIKMRRRVVTEVNALEREIHAEAMARLKERQDADAEIAKGLTKMGRIIAETNDGIIQADNKALDNYLKIVDKRKKADEAAEDFKKDLQAKSLALVGSHLDASMSQMESNYSKEKRLAEANGQDTTAIDEKYEKKRQRIAAAQKKFKVAEALITTYQMAALAYKDGLEAGGPAGLVLGPVAAGVAVLAGLANVRQILAQDVGGGGGGSVPTPSAQTPAPQMMQGAFTLGGGETPEPARAYVVSDDITNNQNKLAIIRRRATI